MTKQPQSILPFLYKQSQERPEATAVRYFASGRWEEFSWREYKSRIESLADSLIELGAKPKDRIAIYASSRVEWALFDLASQMVQAVVIPIYPTIAIEELQSILEDAKPKFVVVENGLPTRLLRSSLGRFPFIEKILSLESPPESQSLKTDWIFWKELPAPSTPSNERQRRMDSIKIKDCASIVYTSGTSGTPKGVLLSHEQILSEVIEAFTAVGVEVSDVSLSILPYSHILGRIEIWGHLFAGFTMGFGRSIDKAREDLAAVRPTVMMAVPRVFEKFHSLIMSKLETTMIQSRVADWALSVGYRVAAKRTQRKPLSLPLFAGSLIADRLFLEKVKALFGGRLKFAICGGAPLDPQVARFFHACDVLLLEGYGLTETTGAICVNTPSDYEFGTVGKPLPDVELAFAEDGEILVRSKKVALGYNNNPEATANVFGAQNPSLKNPQASELKWFATGDIGELTPAGRLRITDRKKDLIKTAGGKYIAPQKLEALLQNHPLISQVLVHGDRRKYIVALITLEKEEAIRIAKERSLKYQDFASLTQHPEILKQVRSIVATVNSGLANFETIKKFAVLKAEFSVESGELTPSLKIRRKVVDQKYHDLLDELYSG